ncbi:MAG TPA: hypothetical protein VG934_01425 [Candidatus Paceibacterota bacterium]|nr:hypothetical protein [Candidatus Paceibacterota bacterium]
MASGITVDAHTHADNIGQLALAGADAANNASATGTNVASLASVDGDWTGNTNVSAEVNHAIQLGAAVAISDFNYPGYGTATATVDNLGGVADTQVNNVDNGAWINTSAEADHVAQAGLAVALSGYGATADVANIAALDSAKVNVVVSP